MFCNKRVVLTQHCEEKLVRIRLCGLGFFGSKLEEFGGETFYEEAVPLRANIGVSPQGLNPLLSARET